MWIYTRKIITVLVLLAFATTSINAQAFAAVATPLAAMPWMPSPGSMVNVSPSYQPSLIKGLTVHRDNPFLFDFIVDPGDAKLSADALKDQADRMIKYFFASLTLPDKDIWVNLSPYEKDRMVPQALAQTLMGRDLLAQDYMLKQLTASLIYPQRDLGKTFWAKIYAQAQASYGTTQVPVNTFNKVWIVPQKADVYEHGQTAYIVNGHLKVMLEEDYLAQTKHNAILTTPLLSKEGVSNVNALGSKIIRQIILPEIEKEINQGQNFATLRQIFYAQVLAVWFKRNLKEALLNRVYANKGTVKGIDQNDKKTNDAIYHQYLRAYKKGVFNYIQEDIDPISQESIPRKYFSGGYSDLGMLSLRQLASLSLQAAARVFQETKNALLVSIHAALSENERQILTRMVATVVLTTALGATPSVSTAAPSVSAASSLSQKKCYQNRWCYVMFLI